MQLDLLLGGARQRALAIAAWLAKSVAMLGSFAVGEFGARPARVRSFDPRTLRAVQDFRRRGSDRCRSR